MKPFKSASALASASLAILFVSTPPLANAQTTYVAGLPNTVTTVRGAVFPNTNPAYTAIEFQTGNNGVFWVDQDAEFTSSAINAVFTTTSFVSDSTNRVSASLLGTDELITPVNGRIFAVQNFFLNNVDFDTGSTTPGAVKLEIQARNGGDMILGMANSSMTGLETPRFWAPARLYFNVSGSSQISSWIGNIGSATSLDVASGSTFRIKDSGLLNPSFPAETLNFHIDASYANVNNATLTLDTSNLRWGSSAGPGSEMTFSNNATLELTGQSKLRTHDLTFLSSTLAMSNNTRIDVLNNMVLDNSTMTAGSGAAVYTDRLVAKGTSSVSANGEAIHATTLDLTTPGSALILVDDFAGLATTRVTGGAVLFPTTGAATTLSNRAILAISDSSMVLNQRSVLINGPLGLIDLQGSTFAMDGSATFTNNRDFTVQAGTFGGTAQFGTNSVIGGGSGSTIRLDSAVNFDPATRAQNSLTTANELFLDSTNTVITMYLNPTTMTSDQFILGGQLNIDSDATLNLGVTNDVVLALGEKFVLFDFSDSQTISNNFKDRTNGSTFSLGLNTYEILYNDPDVQPGGSTSFITVTTVPEPSTWALLGLGGLVLLVCTRRASARNLAVALLAGIGLCQSSQASIMWSGPVDINIPSNINGVYLNVVTGNYSTSPLSHTDLHAYVAGGTLLSFDSDYDFPFGNGFVSGLSGQSGVNNLPDGYTIGPSHISWSQDTITYASGQTASPFWTPNSISNLVGFRFNNEVTSQVHYGWASISLSADYSSQPMSIVSYAYESAPNTAISAGAVPEPSTWSLLGVAGLVLAGRVVRRWR